MPGKRQYNCKKCGKKQLTPYSEKCPFAAETIPEKPVTQSKKSAKLKYEDLLKEVVAHREEGVKLKLTIAEQAKAPDKEKPKGKGSKGSKPKAAGEPEVLDSSSGSDGDDDSDLDATKHGPPMRIPAVSARMRCPTLGTRVRARV